MTPRQTHTERKEMVLNKPRQTRRELPLEDKCRLIREKESGGKSCRELAEIFSIGKSQVSQIMKRKVEYLEGYEENAPGDRKRVTILQSQGMHDVDNLTFKWFQQARGNNIPVSGPMLQEKARELAQIFKTISSKYLMGGCYDPRHITTSIKQQFAGKVRA